MARTSKNQNTKTASARDLMAEMAKSYRIEIDGNGPFFGVIISKKTGKRIRNTKPFDTDSSACLATRALLTSKLKSV